MATTAPTIIFFFFNDTATTEIYTLSLHDALPIFESRKRPLKFGFIPGNAELLGPEMLAVAVDPRPAFVYVDRKSTRLNSSHSQISYAVFCLKKKNLEKISYDFSARPSFFTRYSMP